ncbi:MAG TPA: helix-turn-helix domain-containing protein [Oscillospiraceae bacterium]|nr:helix-turn-helix domain-containing protein [Oscillospiraceae bacterium]
MDRKILELSTEKELKIFMDPLRQRMLRTMAVIGKPVTAKKLSDAMKITPAAAKHHLLRLESIGLVGVDHTEEIHGITATYYALLPVDVRLGMEKEMHRKEKSLLAENMVRSIFEAFCKKIYAHPEKTEYLPFAGDLLTGVVHLRQEEADRLGQLILQFIREHDTPAEGTVPFEYALITYNAEEDR